MEAGRDALDAWIRTTGAFHAVLGLDRALRDPAAPERMLAAHDSGDHLHPGDAATRRTPRRSACGCCERRTCGPDRAA
ncbi:hypothetical protein [Streptomyces sp. DSM 15324]|uniref:hypothetical protein n=1 Tax=Streptomyces sp. DSM 15324 TaxID=1739111 RepID=UPI00074A5E8E|nr:hypothetical protein [Streptomyces sp. DSM 15324]KUO12952.1 hypothetical protein AQJ58_07080 [Streptomyces sp. DSM 15324]